ncbi:unnamed protein product, partial [Rotaria magnacalcarata]
HNEPIQTLPLPPTQPNAAFLDFTNQEQASSIDIVNPVNQQYPNFHNSYPIPQEHFYSSAYSYPYNIPYASLAVDSNIDDK